MSIQEFLNKFDKRLYKMKSYRTVQLDSILAYCLLKSANLSNNHEELIKAIIPELKHNLIKDQLKETFKCCVHYIFANLFCNSKGKMSFISLRKLFLFLS